MRRLLQRRRRRWAGLAAFFAAVAVETGATLVPALQFGAPDRSDSDEGYRITSGWTRNLLQSPTRGSLHRRRPAAGRGRARDPRVAPATPPLGRVRLLFLGDVAGRRFVAYARYNDNHAALDYNDGDPGDSAARLLDGGSGNLRLDPLVKLTSRTVPAMVGLVPADCRIATSATGTVEANGDVSRAWTEAPQGSWVTRESPQPERWRVTCPAGLLFEAPAMPVDETTGKRTWSPRAV